MGGTKRKANEEKPAPKKNKSSSLKMMDAEKSQIMMTVVTQRVMMALSEGSDFVPKKDYSKFILEEDDDLCKRCSDEMFGSPFPLTEDICVCLKCFTQYCNSVLEKMLLEDDPPQRPFDAEDVEGIRKMILETNRKVIMDCKDDMKINNLPFPLMIDAEITKYCFELFETKFATMMDHLGDPDSQVCKAVKAAWKTTYGPLKKKIIQNAKTVTPKMELLDTLNKIEKFIAKKIKEASEKEENKGKENPILDKESATVIANELGNLMDKLFDMTKSTTVDWRMLDMQIGLDALMHDLSAFEKCCPKDEQFAGVMDNYLKKVKRLQVEYKHSVNVTDVIPEKQKADNVKLHKELETYAS